MLNVLFDKLGKEALIDESEAYAKRTDFDNGTVRYYVKRCTNGNMGFLNPQSMWFDELNQKKFDKRSNYKNTFEFKKVNAEIFKLYLHFLKTKNQCFLRQAERVQND